MTLLCIFLLGNFQMSSTKNRKRKVLSLSLLLEMTTTTTTTNGGGGGGGGIIDELASRLDRLGFIPDDDDDEARRRRRGDDFDDFTETDSESDWSDAEQKESDQQSRYERPTLARASGGQGRPWASKARRKKFVESRERDGRSGEGVEKERRFLRSRKRTVPMMMMMMPSRRRRRIFSCSRTWTN